VSMHMRESILFGRVLSDWTDDELHELAARPSGSRLDLAVWCTAATELSRRHPSLIYPGEGTRSELGYVAWYLR
jgi:hypothetical protein